MTEETEGLDLSIHASAAAEAFLRYSRTYSHINALGPQWEEAFAEAMRLNRNDEMKALFKSGFAAAATGTAISAHDYENATGWDFDSEVEYRSHLIRLWKVFYGDEDPRDWVR